LDDGKVVWVVEEVYELDNWPGKQKGFVLACFLIYYSFKRGAF